MLSLAFIGGVFATGVAITASGECLHDEMKELAPNFCFFPEESSYKASFTKSNKQFFFQVCNIVALSAMLAFLLIGGATNAINAKTMRTRSVSSRMTEERFTIYRTGSWPRLKPPSFAGNAERLLKRSAVLLFTPQPRTLPKL